MRFLFALHPQGVRRQTLRKGRCAAVGNPPAYPLRVLALRAVLALSLVFLAWSAPPAAADTMDGVVFAVIDGDTVLFKPDHYHPSSRAFLKVRLAGIDAPEHDQPHGDAATEALKARVLKRRAQLEIVATDVYGRKVGRLTVDAQSVNAEMVRRGLAWAYDSTRASVRSGAESFRASTRGGDRNGMSALQREARRERVGLWQDAEPTSPWVWRKAQAASVP